MPETWPDHAPSPRTMLVWDGTRYRPPRTHTDGTLQVRGEDQLFTYRRQVSSQRAAVLSGADGYADSQSPADGYVWVITNVTAQDRHTATTSHWYLSITAMADVNFHRETVAFAATDISEWHGHLYLEHDDVVRVYFWGGLATDTAHVQLTGYEMSKE